MVDDKTIVGYIQDTIVLLKKMALEARQEELKNSDDHFVMGEVFCFARVINLLQRQARSFCIPLKELGLHDIDPDEDLKGLKRSALNPFIGDEDEEE